MRIKAGVHAIRCAMLGISAAAMLVSAPSFAQVSTASIKGRITQAGAPAKGAMHVVAVNTASGFTYKTSTNADGGYVLTGLPPGSYEMRIAGPGGEQKSETVTVNIGETASLDLALGVAGEPMSKVVILGSMARKDVKSPEVGTSVSRAQIENLPQVNRNFLSFADLAPGVRFNVDAAGNGKVQSGSQNQDNVNVFIDGVSQKNYILRGGIAGLDSSRGNPFPQSAVAEYKIISQNYKAEYDQVSSAAITAATKSGGNEFHGEVFFDHTRSSWSALDPFQKKAKAEGIERPDAKQNQFGFSLGGPIKRDALHFFVAYEGKDINEPRQVIAQRTDLLPNAGIVPSLLAQQGAATSKFKEHLLLGKITAQIAEDQDLELSVRVRREKDLLPEDRKLSVPENQLNRSNEETRFDVKHEWSSADWRNEARFGYEDYTYNPHSNANTPMIKYVVSPTNTANNTADVLFTGGSPNAQHRSQRAYLLQDDLTFTGRPGHTFKVGAKAKHVTFDLSGTSRSVDVIRAMINTQTGIPTVIQTDAALAPVGVSYSNNQLGIYLQDDWQVSNQLELNLGVRYDYETNMLNDSYVTPADRVAIFDKQDPRDGAPAGQTYAQSLAKGGVRIGDYISDGSSRKPFKRAIQPRIGFSYDLRGDKGSVVFGGWGRAYDRTMANHALDETQKNAQPNGEIWLIKNDHKMAYTDQFSLGLRQSLGRWNGEAGVTYSYSHNQFNWFGGNRDPQGGWGTQSPIDPLWGSVPPFGTLILGDFITQAKTRTAYLKADKPFTVSSGWGLSATYTFSDGETTNKEWTNDIFNWTFGRSTSGWNPSTDVERHRLVLAGVTDGLLPWGFNLSGKVTVGSGLPFRITDCSQGWIQCVSKKGEGGPFRQVDLGASKDIGFAFGRIIVRADILNLFNTVNYGSYDSWGGGPGNPQNYLGGDNSHLGVAGGVSGPMRTVKLSARYVF